MHWTFGNDFWNPPYIKTDKNEKWLESTDTLTSTLLFRLPLFAITIPNLSENSKLILKIIQLLSMYICISTVETYTYHIYIFIGAAKELNRSPENRERNRKTCTQVEKLKNRNNWFSDLPLPQSKRYEDERKKQQIKKTKKQNWGYCRHIYT